MLKNKNAKKKLPNMTEESLLPPNKEMMLNPKSPFYKEKSAN